MKVIDSENQAYIMAELRELISQDKLPRYIIFKGMRGCGRTFITEWLCNQLQASRVNCGKSIDDVRDAIKMAYKNKSKTVYTFINADNMSLQAKNSLLKVTEEPPNDSYFVMTVEDMDLDTLTSRAVVYNLYRNTPSEIGVYADDKYGSREDGTLQLYKDICYTFGEVDLLYNHDPKEFYAFVCKVVANILPVSGANVFKMGEKINFKDDKDKYDLKLFWRCFNTILYRERKMTGVNITSYYINKLDIKGINKQMLFDMWILDIRKEYLRKGIENLDE